VSVEPPKSAPPSGVALGPQHPSAANPAAGNRRQGTVAIPAPSLGTVFHQSWCTSSCKPQSGTHASAVLAFRHRLVGIEPCYEIRGYCYSRGQVPNADTEVRARGHIRRPLEDRAETSLADCGECQDPCLQERFRGPEFDPLPTATTVVHNPLWSMLPRLSHSIQKWGFHAISQR